MVGVVSGNGLGLFNTSLDLLGSAQGSPTSLGQAKGAAYVNAATGNLSVQFLDESLSGKGADLFALRTYNSLGTIADGDADGWRWVGEKQVILKSGTVGAIGSTVERTHSDGSKTLFTCVTSNRYESTDGSGAHDVLIWRSASGEFELNEDGATTSEYYNGTTGWIKRSRDNTATNVGFDYAFTGNKLTSVIDIASLQRFDFVYQGFEGRLSELRTYSVDALGANGQLLKQVSYEYYQSGAQSGMLKSVTTDLTPTNTADNQIYFTSYEYDTNKRLIKIDQSVNGDGTSARFEYYADGRVWKAIDQTGTTTFTYDIPYTHTPPDVPQAITRVSNELGNTWEYRHQKSNGYLRAYQSDVIGSARQSAAYTYDSQGNLKTVTDGRGNIITYEYDANGNRTKEYDSLGNTVSRTFGTANRVLTETRYSDTSITTSLPVKPETTRYVYDTANRLRFVISAEGRVSENLYNSFGLVTSTRQYVGNSYTGSTATLTDLTNWVAAATTDKTKIQLSEFAYDYRGSLIKTTSYAKTDAAGNGVFDTATDIVEYTYSAHGQLLQTIRTTGAIVNDVNGGKTRATRTTLSSSIYDGMGRQVEVTQTSTNYLNEVFTSITTTEYAGPSITVTNKVNGIQTLTTVSTTDASGRLTSLSQSGSNGGGTNSTRITNYYYDAAGQLRMTQDPTGARTYFFYDVAGRVNAKVDAAGAVTSYTHDADGRILTETRHAIVLNVTTWSTTPPTTLIPALSNTTDRKTTYEYDQSGRLLNTLVDGGLEKVVNTYDGASRLIQTTQGARTTKYYYDKDGRQIGTLDAEKSLVENQYDHVGRLIKTIRYGKPVTTVSDFTTMRTAVAPAPEGTLSSYYYYDAQGRLTGSVNEQGFLSTIVYDAAANTRSQIQYMTAVTVPANATLTALIALAGTTNTTITQYDTLGRVDKVTTQDGTISRNIYDGAGRLVRHIQAEGTTDQRATRTQYNAFGQVTGVVSGVGEATLSASATAPQITTAITNYGTTIQYDGAGRKVAELGAFQTGKPQAKTFLFYNAAGQLTYTVNALGEVAKTLYNAFGQVKEVYVYSNRMTPANLATITMGGLESNIISKLPSSTASGDIYTYTTHNKLGFVATVDANSAFTTNSYNTYGQLEIATQRISSTANTITRFNYDLVGRIKNTVRDDGGLAATNSVIYDGFGRVRYTTDANNKTTETKYELNGRVIQILDPLGRSRKTEIDALGRTLNVYDGFNNLTSYAYDDTSRSFTVTSPEGVAITTTTTRTGETLTVKDGNNNVTTYAYTKDGKLDTVKNALNVISTDNTYDNVGRLYESKDANGVITRYTYDAANRVTEKAVDPTGLNIRTSYQFDGAGRQILVTEGVGTSEASATEYRYNSQNKISYIIVDPTGLKLATGFTYDDTGNTLTVSKGVFNTTSNGITTVDQKTQYIFDKLGRKTSEIVDPGTGKLNITTHYKYDANGNLTRVIDANENSTWFVYDDAGQKTRQVTAEGGVTTYSYDSNGRLHYVRSYANTIATTSFGDVVTSITIPGSHVHDRRSYSIYDKDGRFAYSLNAINTTEWSVAENIYDAAGNIVETRAYDKYITETQINSMTTIGTAQGGFIAVSEVSALITAWGYSATAMGESRVTRSIYDAANRLQFTVDAEGAVTENIYDANGNVVRTVNYANKVPSSGALNLFYRAGTNRSAAKSLGNFVAGDIVTATVRFKAPTGISGRVFLGDNGGSNPYDNDVGKSVAGNDGWQTITVSHTMTHDDMMSLYVYTYGSDSAHSIIYDDITVTSEKRGTVLAENFENGISSWAINGYAEPIQLNNFDATSNEKLASFLPTLADAKQDSVTSFIYDKANRLRFNVNAEGAVTETIYDANGNVIRTVQYAKTISIPTINSTDSNTLSLSGNTGWLAGTQKIAIDTSKTYTVSARIRQVSGEGRVYIGVKTYDSAGNGIINPYQGSYSYAATSGVLLTPDMGWQTFTGSITGVDPVALGASMNKFLEGTATAVPLLLYNYYGNTSDDLGRVVELDSFELIDNTTGDVINLNASMQSGTSSWSIMSNGVDSVNSATNYLSESQLTKLLHTDAVNDRTTNSIYDAANRLRFSINSENAVTETKYDNAGNVKEIIQYANKLSTANGAVTSPSLESLTIATNRLSNAYFAEPDAGGTPVNWVRNNYNDANTGIFGVNPVGTNPMPGLQLAPEENMFYIKQVSTSTNFPGSYQELTQTVPVTEGKHYSFSVHVSSKAVSPEVLIRWLDGNGNIISTTTAGQLPVSNGYFYVRAIAKNTAPANAVQAQLVLKKPAGTTESYLYAARPQFEELPSLSSSTTNWVKSSAIFPSENDRKTVYEYDKAGRQTKTIMAGWYDVNDAKVYGFNGDTDRFQRTIEVKYDALGNAISNKIRVGTSDYIYQYKTYDKAGREVNDIDGMGHVTQKTYDAIGNVKTVTRSSSQVAVKTTGFWLNSEISVQTGRTITYDYDKAGRQTKVTQPTTGTTGYRSTDTATTNGTLSTYSSAAVTEFAYDALGNLTKQTQLIDNAGRKAESYFYYDKLGRQIWSVDAEKYATKTTYDALGNVERVNEYAAALTTTPVVGVIPSTPAANNKDRTTTFTYDKLGQAKTTTRTINAISNGNMVTSAISEAKNYNVFGNVVETIDAMSNSTLMEYNRLGNLTKVTEPLRVVAGKTNNDVFVNQLNVSPVTSFTYNTFGESTEQTRSATAAAGVGFGQAITIKHIFDVAGNEIQTIDGEGNNSYSLFDVGGRVIAQKQGTGLGIERRFEYDKAGRQIATYDIYDSGTKKTGQYNKYNTYGEITEEYKVWGAASATTSTLMGAATSNVIVNRYEYDNAGRIKLKQGSEGFIYYYFDLTGKITRMEQRESVSNTSTQRITENYYDLLGRMTVQRLPQYAVTTSNFEIIPLENPQPGTSVRTPKLVNTYDRWGNVLTCRDAAEQITTYTYNQNNQLLSEVGPKVSTITLADTTIETKLEHQIVYDKLGRTVQDKYIAQQVNAYGATISTLGTHTNTNFYNAAGQLIETVDAMYNGSSYYDEFGNKVSNPATGGHMGVRQQYAYDIHGNKVGSKDSIGYVKVDTFNRNNQVTGNYILRQSNTTETSVTAEYKSTGVQTVNPVRVKLSTYTYDSAGRKYQEVDATNKTTTFSYDERNNLTRTSTGIYGSDKTYEYDELGNKTAEKQLRPGYNTTNPYAVLFSKAWNYKASDGIDFTNYAINLAKSQLAYSSNSVVAVGYSYTYTGFGQLDTETYNQPGNSSTVKYVYYSNGLQDTITDISTEYVKFDGTLSNIGGQGDFTTKITSKYYYDIKGNRTVEVNNTTLDESAHIETSEYYDGESTTYTTTNVAARSSGTSDLYSFYRYDNQNRLTSTTNIREDYKIDGVDFETSNIGYLEYQYDEWGNRRKISSNYIMSDSSFDSNREEWFTYNAANQVEIEGGINFNGTIGFYKDSNGKSQGIFYEYDPAGRRQTEQRWYKTEPQWSGNVTQNGSTTFVTVPAYEHYEKFFYTYNDLSLVNTVQRKTMRRNLGNNSTYDITISSNMIDQETNTYDNRGFKTKTVFHKQDNDFAEIKYDSQGRVLSNITWSSSKTYKRNELTSYNYTSAGEISLYVYRVFKKDSTNEEFNNLYSYSYAQTLQGRQVSSIRVTSSQDGTGKGTTTNRYDLRGRMVSSKITEGHLTNTSKTGDSHLKFVYNASGQILVKAEDRYDGSSIYKTQHYYYSPTGGELANIGVVSGINISPLSAISEGGDTPTTYTVNAGDTLMGISQTLFGDSKFWYLIADANDLAMGPMDYFDSELIGKDLRIPNNDKSVSNTSNNWKPYNPGEVIGDLTPDPKILPPKKAGCNVIAMIIMVVIAVVLTIVTAGAAAAAMGASAGGLFATGTAALSGGLGAAMAAAGTVATGFAASAGVVAAGMAAAAVGGFVGSVGSQLAGKAMGVVDHFSLRQAVGSGLTAGFASGAGAYLQSVGNGALLAKNADGVAQGMKWYGNMAQGAASYAGAYASNKIAGIQTTFRWSDMAVATVSAGIMGSKAMQGATKAIGGIGKSFGENLAGNFMGSALNSGLNRLTGRGTTMHGNDWGSMAADAFGNALATEVVKLAQAPSAQERWQAEWDEKIKKLEAAVPGQINEYQAKKAAAASNNTPAVEDTVDPYIYEYAANKAAGVDQERMARREKYDIEYRAKSDELYSRLEFNMAQTAANANYSATAWDNFLIDTNTHMKESFVTGYNNAYNSPDRVAARELGTWHSEYQAAENRATEQKMAFINDPRFVRTVGAVQATFGALEMWAGGALSSTVIGASVGVPLILVGADNVYTGGVTLAEGQYQDSLKVKAMVSVGVDPVTAGYVDLGLNVVVPAGAAATPALLRRLPTGGATNSVESLATRRAYLNEKYGRTGDLNLDINIRGNQETAFNFYLDQGWSPKRIQNHVAGIDFSQPVDIFTLSAGKPVAQFQVAGNGVGNYFAPIGTRAEQLGVNPTGRQTLIYAPTERVQVLRTTAAPIVDTWSIPGVSYNAKGGGTQFFTGDTSKFRVILNNE